MHDSTTDPPVPAERVRRALRSYREVTPSFLADQLVRGGAPPAVLAWPLLVAALDLVDQCARRERREPVDGDVARYDPLREALGAFARVAPWIDAPAACPNGSHPPAAALDAARARLLALLDTITPLEALSEWSYAAVAAHVTGCVLARSAWNEHTREPIPIRSSATAEDVGRLRGTDTPVDVVDLLRTVGSLARDVGLDLRWETRLRRWWAFGAGAWGRPGVAPEAQIALDRVEQAAGPGAILGDRVAGSLVLVPEPLDASLVDALTEAGFLRSPWGWAWVAPVGAWYLAGCAAGL
jgi:hypothetical protein